MPNAFEILGVAPNSSDEELRTAYWRLARIYHPDRYATASAEVREEAERRMAELNAAFEAVRDGWGADFHAPAHDVPSGGPAVQQTDRDGDIDREIRFRRWEEAEKQARLRGGRAHDDEPHGEPEGDEAAAAESGREGDPRRMHAVHELWERRNERVDAEARAEAQRLEAERERLRAEAEQTRREWLEQAPASKAKRRRFRRKN